jgi:hypothetical protein
VYSGIQAQISCLLSRYPNPILGPFSGLSVTNVASLNGSTALVLDAYGYDNASRLKYAQDGTGNGALYSYIANSPLVSQIMFTNSGGTRMTTTCYGFFCHRTFWQIGIERFVAE